MKELLPRFDIPTDSQSQSTCMLCCKHIPIDHTREYCSCKCRVYCSELCKYADELHNKKCTSTKYKSHCCYHSLRDNNSACVLPPMLLKIIEAQAALNDIHVSREWGGIHGYLTIKAPEDMYGFERPHTFNEALNEESVKTYFTAREELIRALVHEAFSVERTNTLALDIALLQCKDLFHLDKFDSNYARKEGLSPKKEYLLNLLLFTGRYEEHYTVCCYYATMGEQFVHTPPNEITASVMKWEGEGDISGTFFYEHSIYHRHFPFLSLTHIFILKYILHLNMENLRLLHLNVLDNIDCVALIGEFIGVKKEWLKFDKNWYKDQALEVLREFARGDDLAGHFGNMHGLTSVFLGSGKYKQIDTALKIGRGQLKQYRQSKENMSCDHISTNWIVDRHRLKGDIEHIDLHRSCIHPIAVQIAKLNEIVGYSAFGANYFSYHFPAQSLGMQFTPMSATKFLTEVMEVCEKKSPDSFYEFFLYIDEELEAWLSEDLLSCLLLERRFIQAHFYSNFCFDFDRISIHSKSDSKFLCAQEVVKALAPELSPLNHGHPLPLLDDDSFLNYPMLGFREKEDVRTEEKIRQIGRWLPDVTKVIDALYHAGLATDDNLTSIFGDSSMVSYRLYELRKMNEKKNQHKITSFFSRKRKAGA